MWGDSGDGIELRRWRRMTRSMVLRCWSMKFLCFGPLHTLITSEFEGKALGSYDHGSNINKYVSIDGFTCEIEIFVSLYVKGCHQLQILL
jgi:hypothetical protein